MNPRGIMVIHHFRPLANGAELQAERLAIKLAELDHPMQVFTELRTPDSLPVENLQGVKVHRVNFRMAYWFNRFIGGTLRYLVKHRHSYDVIHAHQAFGHAMVSVLVARLFSKRCIIKIACAGEYGDMSVMTGFDGYKWALRVMHQVDKIIAVSSEVEQELLGYGFPSDHIIRIPNGVDANFFQRKNPMPARDKVRFIHIGRRHPQKGVDTMLEAVKILVDLGYEDRFEVKCYGNDFPEYDYQVMARELMVESLIELLPFTEFILDVYQEAHCFILPSRGEGLSNALLEAMAMELAVIATYVSGTVDVIEDGRDGILIQPDSPEELAEAMATIIQDQELSLKLGQNARRKVIRDFSLDSVAQQYSDLYTNLLNGK